jgi:23S rRNA (cytosine1962-C5)-methyltransferase
LPLALKAYEKLYRKSLQIVKDDGIVCFASCSHHLNENMFKEVVLRAVKKEKKILREIRFLGAAPDHPKLITMPETSYLKFGVYQVFSL